MVRSLSIVAIQLWIFAFVTFFGTDIVLLEPSLRVAAQLIFALPLIGWSVFRLRRLPDRVDLALMVGLGLYLVVALASRDRTGSLETLGLVTIYALTFWAARTIMSSPSARQVIAVGVATALAFTLALNAFLLLREKVAYIQATGLIPPQEGFDVFPWETANAMPILVLLAIGFLPLVQRGPYRRVLIVITAVASLLVESVSTGRAGQLGLGVALLFLVLMSDKIRSWFAVRPSPLRWSLAAGTALVGIIGIWRAAGPFVHAMDVTGRLDLYPASLSMFLDRPLFGSGPSTWPWARYMFGTEAARTLGVRLTHDMPLQTLADGGIVLAAAMLIVVLAWLTLAFSWSLPLDRRIAIAVLLGYAAAVLFDDFSFLPAVTVLLIVLAAGALPRPPLLSKPPPVSYLRFTPVLSAAACLVIAVPFVVRVDLARLNAADARSAAVAGDWRSAAQRFGTAIELHPESGGYWLGLAKARAELGDVAAAESAYDAARAASPGDARAYGGLAALTSSDEERITLLQQAADRTSGDPQYAYRLGIALAEAGDSAAAATAWGRAADLRSSGFGVFEFERYGIDPVAVMQAAITHTREAPRPDVNVDPAARSDVRLTLHRLTSDAGLAWRAVDMARSGDVGAGHELAEEARVSRAMYAYEAVAAVAAFACDMSAQQAALTTAAQVGSSRPADLSGGGVTIRREYLYREPTIGSMQPPNTPAPPPPDRWPWSVIAERPSCS
jgi:tetratricopeptide (TPR) repeat protein